MYDEDYDEPHDYGFNLPDTRHEFITKDGGNVSIRINRHWYTTEDDETGFKVSWDIHYHNPNTNESKEVYLPIGSTEDQAVNIAHTLWEEDTEASDDIREMRAEEEAERRMGA
jgi:hypothetical protein